jgi:broad specificity phosphatase PhoE
MRPTCTTSSSPIRAARSSNRNAVRFGVKTAAFELVIVRHGRTAWNAAGLYQGHTDIPLDETGRRQAAALGRALAGSAFTIAVASDLVRARETAEIVLGTRAEMLECDARWREMRFGAWEGLTREQILARAPAAGAASVPRLMTPEGGETFAELKRRIGAALEAIVRRAPAGSRALVATHAGPLHAALQILLGEPAASALNVKFVPASFTSFAIEAGTARLLELNRTPPD